MILLNNLFKLYTLNINVDDSEDDVIHCFKESQPCTKGRQNPKIANGGFEGLQDVYKSIKDLFRLNRV